MPLTKVSINIQRLRKTLYIQTQKYTRIDKTCPKTITGSHIKKVQNHIHIYSVAWIILGYDCSTYHSFFDHQYGWYPQRWSRIKSIVNEKETKMVHNPWVPNFTMILPLYRLWPVTTLLKMYYLTQSLPLCIHKNLHQNFIPDSFFRYQLYYHILSRHLSASRLQLKFVSAMLPGTSHHHGELSFCRQPSYRCSFVNILGCVLLVLPVSPYIIAILHYQFTTPNPLVSSFSWVIRYEYNMMRRKIR